VDFWRNTHNREVLQQEIAVMLDNYRAIKLERLEAVADRLVELAKSLNPRLKS
jgi:type I restriction enzyme R subunit